LEEDFKIRFKTKNYKLNFDKNFVRKYLSSYNRFLLIKHKINHIRRLNFTNKIIKKPNNIKEPEELKQIKRKLNIHMYSYDRFLQKYGVDMLKFLGQLNSTKNNEEYNQVLEIIKRTDVPSFGRKLISVNKKL
jgi:hypothetical protein